MTKFLSFFLTIAITLLSVSNILADQITLKNGDRLSGKIIKQDDEKIILQTEFTGIITISKTNIEKIIADTKFTEETKEEETTKKDEVAQTDVAENDTVAKTENNDEEKDSTATTAVPAPQISGLTAGWDGSANLGFSMSRGNAVTTTFTAGLRAERSTDKDKWTVYLNSLWNRNRVAGLDVTASNAFWGGVRYDRNITSKLFAFGSYDFERDIPQLLKYRSVAGGGLGYHVIKNDKTELDVFGGAAWNKTWFIGATTSSAEVLVGNTLKHKFNDKMRFQQGFTFYPNMTDGGEFRFIFDSTLSADLTKRIGWFVTVGDRYNSAPMLGAQKNDFLLSTGIKIGFGKTK